jgi:hypothetical protein
MKKIIMLYLLLAYSLVFSQETVRIEFNTGDKQIDTHLNSINVYAGLDIDLFKKDLTVKFGVAIEEVDRYIVKERIPPAEVYYGHCMASVTGKSFSSIIQMRSDKNGWGAIAKDLGIKPGSKQFHALKNSTLKKIDKDKIKKLKKQNNKQKNKSVKKSK